MRSWWDVLLVLSLAPHQKSSELLEKVLSLDRLWFCQAFIKDQWTGQRNTGCKHLPWHVFEVFNNVVIWKRQNGDVRIWAEYGRDLKDNTFVLPGYWEAWEQIIAKALPRPILCSQFSTQKSLKFSASFLFEEAFVQRHTLIRWSQKGAPLKPYTNLASK